MPCTWACEAKPDSDSLPLPLAVRAAVGRLRHNRRVATKRSNGLGAGLISAGRRQNAVGAGACGRQRNLHRHDRWCAGKWFVYRQCQKHVNGAGRCWRSRARDWLQPKCERSHFAARFERFSGPQQCPCVDAGPAQIAELRRLAEHKGIIINGGQ